MARPPITDEELIERYGPHLNRTPPGGWNAGIEVDRVVDTHCCFCGQQCGIKLKVHDNEVVGFEPWYDFPFNEGKLCPKGVKRYLQGSHPDRVLYPMERDGSAPGGFRRVSWDHALDRVVNEIRRIQDAYGPDSFAMLSGVSLTNEKSYLIGKFARLALGTRNLDYNGRLCMVSAGAGNKKAFGLDRASNTYEDLAKAEVILVAGANVSETFPSEVEGWQYFRPRVEGSFLRFFWSPEHRTWLVEDKSGTTMELGAPLDSPSDAAALEVNPDDSDQVYKWHLVRQYDSQRDADGQRLAIGHGHRLHLAVPDRQHLRQGVAGAANRQVTTPGIRVRSTASASAKRGGKWAGSAA